MFWIYFEGKNSVLNKKQINVLLVDDEEVLLNAIRRRLEFRDFHVIAVDSGEKALLAARENPVDVAIVDLKMPGMNGREVMLALKKAYPWMEVIILTGHGSFDPEEGEVAGKIHTCLAKPCDVETLQEVLIDAYKKTVMNRNQIKLREMDELLKDVETESPGAILRKLKKIDENRSLKPRT